MRCHRVLRRILVFAALIVSGCTTYQHLFNHHNAPSSEASSTSIPALPKSSATANLHTLPTPAASVANSKNISALRKSGEQTDIEKNLSNQLPQPYLQTSLLKAIPLTSDATPTYPDLYFFDVPLSELLDNDYSIKFNAKRQTLKLIFPKSYDSAALYQDQSIEARKLFVIHSSSNPINVSELALIVPDFLPGSSLYQNIHGAMSKVFASLYQVKMPASFSESHRLRMRYRLKLCQPDAIKTCAVNVDNTRSVRAIVIAATLYDSNTKTVIDTFVLK